MADKDTLPIEEQALFERERGLAEMEAGLYEQEQGVVQTERAFKKRNKTLLNLVSYVAEQEANLRRRAEAIGPEAAQVVAERLSRATDGGLGGGAAVGLEEARLAMVARRRELLEERISLVEEREQLIARRYDAIEKAEGATTDIEQRLLRREREISEALRELITASASLQGDDDDDDDDGGDDDDDEDPAPEPERHGPPGRATQHQAEAVPLGREPLQVVGGEVETDVPEELHGAGSRAEDEVTRRRKGRARARTNQFRITLEAQIDGAEAHHFFAYRDDGPEDLPGVFIATPNLLKVGREVRARISVAGKHLEATGIVGWRRQRGEAGGPPGMGVELLNLSEPERVILTHWVAKHPATLI